MTMKIKTKKLEELGWKFDYFYGPGMENMYEKNGRSLRVANYKNKEVADYLITYSGRPNRPIKSLKDLEKYATTGE